MGTNYYFRIKKKRQNEILGKSTDLEKKLIGFGILHIGKSSVGWTFTFQETDYYKSYKELLNFYEENKQTLEIINEYDEIIEIEEFKEIVEYKRKEEKNHTKYVENDEYYGKYSYLDDEGNSFTKTDFS